ncbi:MAG: hypothetical protein AAGC66_00040 [Leifsonia sp.]
MPEEATAAAVGDALVAYHAGHSDSTQLVQVLIELAWPPAPRTTGLEDDYLPNHPWDLIVSAHRDGVIDDALYDTILDGIEACQPLNRERS